MTIYDEYFAKQMKKEEFHKEYESLEPEFTIMQALRTSKELTQKELSKRTGITQSDISKPENNPSVKTLQRFAEAMNIFTVSFFGHRTIEWSSEIENRLDKLLYDIITQKEYVEFLIGRDGEFDLLASSSIRRAIKKYGFGNTAFVLVLPYMRADYRDNEQRFLEYYDEIEICSESAATHYKAAIQVRNKKMVDRSNLVVCCIQHKSGGAYKAVQYAEKRNCRIVNVANES